MRGSAKFVGWFKLALLLKNGIDIGAGNHGLFRHDGPRVNCRSEFYTRWELPRVAQPGG
jgi:hypothetical protein